MHITSGATYAITITKMKATFSSLGLPEILVTDKGVGFASQEFVAFVKANGIRHITSVPYHPASNGLAEKAVQTFKAAMKKLSKGSLETDLQNLHELESTGIVAIPMGVRGSVGDLWQTIDNWYSS